MRKGVLALVVVLVGCGCAEERRVAVGAPNSATARPDANEADGGGASADASGDDAAAPNDAQVPLTDAGTTDAAASDAAATDAVAGDAAPPVADAGPPAATVTGYVGVSQVLSASSQLTTASAGFYRTGALNSCMSSIDGPCQIYVCPSNPVAPTALDGGAVIARVAGVVLTTRFSAANGYYDPAYVQSASWSGGETISVDVAGSASVAPFSATLTAPRQLTLSAPAVPAVGQPLIVARGQPLIARWQGGATAGMVSVTLGGSSGNGTTSAQCMFAPSAGQGTIPASVVALIPATNATYQAYVTVLQTRRAGSAEVTVQSTVNLVSPAGLNAVGLVEFR